MRRVILTPLLALAMNGCGGGEGGKDDAIPPTITTYFEASTQSTQGGQLNPASLRLSAGEQGSFTVAPDAGYVLAQIAGCEGTLDGLTYTTGPMRGDCQVSASFTQETAPVYFEATTQSSQGGRLSPASLRLSAGERGRFTLAPDAGFVLEHIEGCDGTLQGHDYITGPMGADCQVSARFIKHAAHAIAREDHALASDVELIAHARGAIADSEARRTELVRTLYQGLGAISWNPSHDSITFSSFKPENTVTLLPSNINGKGESEIRGLVMVSEQDDYRRAAMGANLFAVDRTPQSEALLRGLIGWLTRGRDSDDDGLRILTAQVPSRADSWYFPHNEGIRDWLKAMYPDAHSINQADECDYQALGACIDRMAPDLIVISDLDRQGLGYQGIAQAIAKAKAAGIPLLLSNYRREASPLLAPLYLEMGLVTWGNYWSKLKVSNLAVSTIMAPDPQLMAVDMLLSNLKEGEFSTQWLDACSGNFLNCGGVDEFNAQFKNGADWLRNASITLDKAGISPFAQGGLALLPASLLLADKYRAAIDYPIAWDEHQAWQRAMFADWLVSYARVRNLAQPDLGEYVVDRSQVFKGDLAHYAYPAVISDSRRISVPYSGQWTSTGWYALPGQRITLSRTDTADVSATIRLNYHRPNTNRAYEQKVYRAPLELASGRLPLNKGGSVSFTTPYGGPVYLYLEGGDGTLQVEVTATGVTHHPAILDFSDEQQIRDFNERLEQTELPHVDLRADGAEQHLRRDRFTGAIGGAIADTDALLDSISRDHINSVYTLAGFKIQGKRLEESLPDEVRRACVALLGDQCLDESLHTRTIIQHANYDQNAHCGVGCSGNPWDSSGSISPTGWLDNHELGHNLQTQRLNVHYVAASDADNWRGYGSRAGENSNNIFPYVVKWQAHYLRDGNQAPIKDGHMNHKDLFYAFMSDAAGVKDKSGNRVVLGANCKVLDAGESRYEAPWQSNAYAIHNGYRMAFYIQMALRAHGMRLADGTRLSNGFNIFTLLYQHSRIFGAVADNESDWNANRDRLGFGLFPFQGHGVYGGKQVRDIPGNDFMLVALGRLTGLDWRSHFDLLGLRYSTLAAAQVQANQPSGVLPMGMYVLEDDLPPANMSEGLTFLPLSSTDGSTLWPRDQGSPASCPIP